MRNQNPFKILNREIPPLIGIFIIVFCLLLAGGILAGQYWVLKQETLTPSAPASTPTPDETANRQTYRNEQYGFEVKYPKDWFVKENPVNPTPSWVYPFRTKDIESLYSISICNTEECLWSDRTPEGKIIGADRTNIDIRISNNPGLSLEQWIDESEKRIKFGTMPEGYGEREAIVVAGVQGFKVSYGCCESAQQLILLSKNNKVYSISLDIFPGVSSDENENTFNKIVSTFRFIGE